MTSLFFNKLRAVSREAVAVCAACVILVGCGSDGGGGGGGPSITTFDTTDGLVSSTNSRLTGDNRANQFGIAGDATTGLASGLSFAGPIDASGNPIFPTGTGTTADAILRTLDSLWINEGGVVNDITDMVAAGPTFVGPTFVGDLAVGNLYIQNFESIIINGGAVNGNINNGNLRTVFIFRSGRVGILAVTANPGATPPVLGVTASGGNITSGDGDDIFNLFGGTVGGTIMAGDGDNDFNLADGTIIGAITAGDGSDEFAIAGDMVTITAPATTAALVIPQALTAGGQPDAPTDDALTLDVDESIETVAERRERGDTLWINDGGVVVNIAENANPPAAGNVNIQGFEAIIINGGEVQGTIANGNTPTIYSFRSGTATGAVSGGSGDDEFVVSGNIVGATPSLTISAALNGAGGRDTFWLNGGGVINNTANATAAGDVNLQGFEAIVINGGIVNGNIVNGDTATTYTVRSGTVGTITDAGNITGGSGLDTFVIEGGAIAGSIVGGGGNSIFTIEGGTIGGDVTGGPGVDTFTIEGGTITGNVVGDAGGDTFSLDGGRVTGNVTGDGGVDTFNLQSGTITGNVDGGTGDDIFNLYSAVRINGFLDGGADADTLNYAGAPADATFARRGGLAQDDAITDGDGSVRNIEAQANVATITSLGNTGTGGAGLRGLTVGNFEVLTVAPALNLYGAMSDALMQFGQQTASGFGLADLDLSTGGRGTSLVSKDSPFSKGKIWAHQIKHSGSGKGTIGLNITGLTARADSDYDYEMTLNQHGFDAPLATSTWGALNLRAVSHTMTGVIETNVAEANVTGYGAGVSMLWSSNGGTLSAHVTSLASAYEVDARTSQLNPRAIVSEVSEGEFSAFNAVISAGVADTRKIAQGLSLRTTADMSWQTLSLDDFSETGADGIVVNFDKATRFAARVGAGLEAKHWFSDVTFTHETSSGGTLSSGLSQDYKQEDGTAVEMRFGGKIADLAEGLTLKAYAGMRTSLIGGGSIEPSARFDLNWSF